MTHTVAIIGAGPAGIAAAIQCHRQGIDCLIFEQGRVGGLLNNANFVENYPGYPNGIAGRFLVDKIVEQLNNRAVPLINQRVIQVDFIDGVFSILTKSETWQAAYLILATGTKAIMAKLLIPPSLNRSVLYEIIEIMDVTSQQIVIVGAGDAAFDYALNLAQKNRVIILNRGHQIKCLPLLEVRASGNENIKYLENTSVTGIEKKPAEQIKITCIQSGVKTSISADYLVYAIGRDPNYACLSPKLRSCQEQMVEKGLLYPVGDIINGRYRQTTIAVADGIRAAMQINTILNSE